MKTTVKHNWILYLILLGASFLIYGQTIGYDYALDDDIVILKNQFTKEGFTGIPDLLTTDSFHGFFGTEKNLVEGGRYRPISLITFAIEWQLFGENPGISHLINILLYGLTAIGLFRLIAFWTKEEENNWMSIAFLSSLLFVLHPIHTEVVANIKGRDEILALLFSLWAVWVISKEKITYLTFVRLTPITLLAVLSKEIGIVIIPFSFLILGLRKVELKDWMTAGISQIILLGIYFGIRHLVFGHTHGQTEYCEILNNPFCGISNSEKYATILSTWTNYLQLLTFPTTLTHDYYPMSIPYVTWGSFKVIGSIIFTLSSVGYGLYAFIKRDTKALLIAGFWLPFLIVCNLFVNIGTFMNERFMYFTSIAWMVLIVGGIFHLRSLSGVEGSRGLANKLSLGIIGLLSLFFTYQSLIRVPAWENNQTLFSTDIKNSSNSIKCNTSYAGSLIERSDETKDIIQKKAYLEEAIIHLDKAIGLYPDKLHLQGWLLKGNAHLKNDQISIALDCYKNCLEINPNHPLAKGNMQILADRALIKNQPKIALHAYEVLLNTNTKNVSYLAKIGEIKGKYLGNLREAIIFLEEAYKHDQSEINVLENLGVAHAMSGNLSLAIKYLLEAVVIEPNSISIHNNLMIAFDQSGLVEEARKHKAIMDQLQDQK